MARDPDLHDPRQLERHRELIRRVAREVARDLHEVDEVEAETFAAAFGGRPPEGEGLAAWLAVVARRVARRRRESAAARTRRERRVARRETAIPSPDEVVAAEETRARVLAAVLALPTAQRDAVLARYHLGLSERNAARELGIPLETLRKRLSRARGSLRAALVDEFDGDAPALALALVPLAALPAGRATGAASTLLQLAMQKQILAVAAVSLALVAALVAVGSTPRPADGGARDGVDRSGVIAAASRSPWSTDVERSPSVAGLQPDGAPARAAVVGTGAARPRWTGRVVGPDGRPVVGARVLAAAPDAIVDLRTIEWAGSDVRIATTADDGSFELAAGKGVDGTHLVAWREPYSPAVEWFPAPTEVELQLGEGQRIGGRVFDGEGAVVAGAEVRVQWHISAVSGELPTSTDAEGRYRAVGLPGREHERLDVDVVARAGSGPVAIESVSSYTAAKRADLEPELDLDLVADVRLTAARPLEVLVLDGARRPVRSAEVIAWHDAAQSAAFVFGPPESFRGKGGLLFDRGLTDARGRWTTSAVASTPRDPFVSLGRELAWVTVRGPDGVVRHTKVGPLRTDGPLEVALPRATEVRGRVVDPTGNSVPGCTVRLRQVAAPVTSMLPGAADGLHSAITAEDGTFVIRGAPVGLPAFLTALTGADPGRAPRTASVPTFGIQLDGPPHEIVLGASDPDSLVQTLVLDPSGAPVPGALVGRAPRLCDVRTGADGRATFAVGEPGGAVPSTFTIGATHPALGETRRTVDPSSGLGTGAPAIELRFDPATRIEGRVLDGAGLPVAEARVRLDFDPRVVPLADHHRLRNAFVRTDARGRFELVTNTSAPHLLIVALDSPVLGRSSEEVTHVVEPGVAPTIVVDRPDAAGAAQVEVVVGGESTVERVRGTWRGPSRSLETTLVRIEDRTWLSLPVEPGLWTLTASLREAPEVTREVVLAPGATTRVELEPTHGGEIGGRVLAQVPLQVSLYRGSVEVAHTVAEPGDSYRFVGLEPGRYHVDPVAAGDGAPTAAAIGATVDLEFEEVRRDVDLDVEAGRRATLWLEPAEGQRLDASEVGFRILRDGRPIRWVSSAREGRVMFSLSADDSAPWYEVTTLPSGNLEAEAWLGGQRLDRGKLEEDASGRLVVRLAVPGAGDD